MDIDRISTQDDLVALANRLGVRPDWHEPDEQDVTAQVHGGSFDNAGFWGKEEYDCWVAEYGHARANAGIEKWVTLWQHGRPVAEVNLATLFAWACGYRGEG